MKVSEAMTRDVRVANPEETLQEAAQLLLDIDSGALPVGENDRLVGMITDRDIAIRGVARGRGPEAKVRDVMTSDIRYCFDDQDVDEVAREMGELQIRRIPVISREKRLVGILSLGDIAIADDSKATAALREISKPNGQLGQMG